MEAIIFNPAEFSELKGEVPKIGFIVLMDYSFSLN